MAVETGSGLIDKHEIDTFVNRIRKADGLVAEQVKAANFELAGKVVNRAQDKASGVGGSAPKAAASLRAAQTQTAATIRGGGSRVPYFFGAEFGSKRYKQFKSWRGNQYADPLNSSAGYFLIPSIRDSQDLIMTSYRDALLKAVDKTGEFK